MARTEAHLSTSDWFVVANATAGIATATKAAAVGKQHYVTGLSISASAAPAAAVTVTLKAGTTVIGQYELPASAVGPTTIDFAHAARIPVNTLVELSAPSLGGGVKCSVSLRGFTLSA